MAWGGPDTARVVAPPPLMFLGAALAGRALDRLLRLPRLGDGRTRLAAGVTLFGAGGALALWAAVLFKRAGTNVVPDRSATALVTSGPFRWSRNPGYIGQTLMYLGLAARGGSLGGLALLGPLLHVLNSRVVVREEAYLERRFGDAYRRYTQTAPRWL